MVRGNIIGDRFPTTNTNTVQAKVYLSPSPQFVLGDNSAQTLEFRYAIVCMNAVLLRATPPSPLTSISMRYEQHIDRYTGHQALRP